MARMGKDGVSSAGTTQVSAKVDPDLKSDFRATCEQNGENMTDVLKEAMRDYVSVQGDGSRGENLPDDDQLASAYQTLREISDPDTGHIDVDAAKPAVSQAIGVSKAHVRRVAFDPLKRRKYITPNYGSLIVHEPNEVPQ